MESKSHPFCLEVKLSRDLCGGKKEKFGVLHDPDPPNGTISPADYIGGCEELFKDSYSGRAFVYLMLVLRNKTYKK